jgi:hypothetical protein
MARILVKDHEAQVPTSGAQLLDWGPAIQAAGNALVAAGGGQLVFPTENIDWRTAVNINPDFRDLDLVWQGGMITVGGTATANTDTGGVIICTIGNVNRFSCNLKFIGHGVRNAEPPVGTTPPKTIDCLNLFSFGESFSIDFNQCDILGVLATQDLIRLQWYAVFRDCGFWGCGTTQAAYAIVHAIGQHRGLVFERCTFLDFGYNGLPAISKTNNPLDSSTNRIWTNRGYWIQVDEPAPANGIGGSEIKITNCRFDEGTPGCLLADGGTQTIDLLWRGNTANIGFNFINTSGAAINSRCLKLNKVRGEIINSWAGLALGTDVGDLPWLEATNSNLIIRGRGKTAYVNRLVKDAATIIKES